MITCYSWPTPNGIKIHVMLEETGLPYRVHGIDIAAGDQFADWFQALNPNGRMPVITDEDGPDGAPITIFESGAILIYLADKAGQFLPPNSAPRARMTVMQWLMFQMAGVGPMLGQANFFNHYCPEDVPFAKDRYTREAGRLYGVMDGQLGRSAYLAGDDYSIADIATWPWVIPYYQNVDLSDFPNLQRWYQEIEQRPAVQRGLTVLADRQAPGAEIKMDDTVRERLYGKTQTDRR